jgi:hypothetical protein
MCFYKQTRPHTLMYIGTYVLGNTYPHKVQSPEHLLYACMYLKKYPPTYLPVYLNVQGINQSNIMCQ